MQWRLREKGFFKARAIREGPISTAMKAVATLNEKVSVVNVTLETDLSFAKFDGKPYRNSGESPTVIEMLVKECETPPIILNDFKVSSKDTSEESIQKLAKAVSMSCHDVGGVRLRCIGTSSIYKAVMSVVIAKGIMFSGGKACRIVPQWMTILEDDHPLSSVLIDFWTI